MVVLEVVVEGVVWVVSVEVEGFVVVVVGTFMVCSVTKGGSVVSDVGVVVEMVGEVK